MRRRENAELKMKIYFDTCVYCRPFDDQSQKRIEKETEAFARILKLAELGKVTIVSSDILIDELEEIVDPRKSVEVREFITICEEHVVFSEEIIKLAKSIEDKCGITGADALHIASSAETKYFITCDDFILLKDECITNFMKKRGYSVEVIGITKFMEDKKIWK
jgi:predicted nucleic acid-binding protein